ncbi:polysaccharide deacetylase [Haloterrigena sp. SYSU A121-1]|uniref:Polysaccharide deacetylase n=1 Tax=Haloterrigena gelatinilytica TaxID=2741724 RepID=A0A8J8GIK9_9EURY|nr:polysaccharide deacetylase [Haloterrigena gelatinilytica]NUB90136.1 polysaccharide deacetylase [Haloterrigena gelatinilytica]
MGTVDVAIGVDADCVAGWLGSYGGADSPADLSRGLAAGNEGIPRMLALFDEQDIETSWYVPGHTIDTFRDEIEAVAADGHELGVHGYSHENPTDLSREQEDEILEVSIDRIEDVTGSEPVGHRASWWEFSENTPELVEKHGFLYDSSLMERMFEPGWMRKGDSWEKIRYEEDPETWMEPYQYGEETDVVEIPISWYRDDIPPMLFIKQPIYHAGYKDPEMMYEQYYKRQFDYLYDRRGAGVYTFTIHPDIHGLPHMIPLLEEFIQYVKSHENARFTTLETIAETYKDDPSVYESESDYV